MRLFNTITRKKEEFIPRNKGIVTMYVCGPTVYDLFHIGNARTFIFFDTVRCYFEYKGYEVKFVQNFTDIDDKIIDKANKQGINICEVSENYIKEYYKDADKLKIKRATLNPKATENIDAMIDLIKNLIEGEFAYEVNGDVYFSIKSFESYGKLFGQDLSTLKSGSRIEINKNKKNPLDFILWKKSKIDEVGYDSPWGFGRPGWHTECCSMIYKYFGGETIDLHCGGFDLIFPHHENEIAQMEVLTNKPLSNYWMHCSFLSINNQKMSKSLNNFFTTREILEKYSGNCLRFFVLSSHYRSELYFSEDQLVWAEKSLDRIYKCYISLLEFKANKLKGFECVHEDKLKYFEDRFFEKMDDDFNTSDAISVIFEMIKYINSYLINFNDFEIDKCKNILESFLGVLGIDIKECVNLTNENLDEKIRDMVYKRYDYKLKKDFNSADYLRNELLNMGISLEDIKNGVRVFDLNKNVLIDTIFY